MIRQFELVERVKSYDALADEDAVNRAYVFATRYHGSQKRASGDPYFSHPVEVAGILADLKLDHTAIIAALLHDTVEDTDATLSDIEHFFGAKVTHLVDGVTKLTRLELQSEQNKHAENFRKLLLAMSEDVRVLLVKLADRLHNMRTLHFIKTPEKRQRIARETMEIYAPLSERIGMQNFKDELEDLSFAQLHSEARDSILTRLTYLQKSDDENLADLIISHLQQDCHNYGIQATVSGRLKTPYSIFRKMQTRDITFEQLSDIMAFRIITDDLQSCYQALGMIHSEYSVVPGRFKDYISTPKPNGYQSIHTVVIGPQNHKVEVQIRTTQMHAVNEHGVAAHWAYKQGDHQPEGKTWRWLQQLIDILEHAHSPAEFLEHTKMEMFQDQVFCFTPRGDLVALPRGATPIDFAYAVHTEIGNRCVGAKVNGRMVQFRTTLHNGDQVQILTSKNQTPSPDWEKLAVSGKAKACIRRFIRIREREQYQRLGQQMLERLFRQEKREFGDKALEGVLNVFQVEGTRDLMVLVGQGHVTAREVLQAVYPEARTQVPDKAPTKPRKPAERGLPIKGLISGMAVHYAKCCHPLPGDRIVGIVVTGKGVTIHTIDCDTLSSFEQVPERWIDVSWDDTGEQSVQTGRLKLLVANERGAFGDLFTVVGRGGGNVINMKIIHRAMDFFEILVDIEVQDVRHLANIQAALRAMSVVVSVERTRN